MRDVRKMRAVVITLLKIILAIVSMPLAAIAALIFRSRAKLYPPDVVSYLRSFIDGDGSAYDWDDFTSVLIADRQLEDIRRRADAVDLPVTEQGLTTLQVLLAEAERLSTSPP